MSSASSIWQWLAGSVASDLALPALRERVGEAPQRSKNRLRGSPITFARWLADSPQGGLWAILLLACIGEALWLAVVNVGFFMDSVQYLRYANVLVGQEMPFQTNDSIGHDMDMTAVARRTAGYPLLLLLTGVPSTGSLIGIVILQAAMAVAMPMLVYKTVEPYGRRAALVTALVLIATLEPFNYSKAILTEQSFKFLLLLLVYLASRAYRAPSRWLFAAIAAVSIMLALVRPQGSFIAILVFAMLAIAHKDRWKAAAASFFAVFLVLGFCSFATALHLAAYIPTEAPGTLQNGSSPTLASRLANLLFYNLYTSRSLGAAASGTAAGGTGRAKLRNVMQRYAEEFPQEWTPLAPRHYFGAFSGNPSAWVEEIYRNPNPYYLNMIKVAIGAYLDSADPALRSAGLFRRVILETYLAEPRQILSFFVRFFLAPAYSSGGQVSWNQFYTSRLAPFGDGNGPASKELLDLAKIYISDFPQYPPSQWRNYPGGPDKLVDDVFVQQPAELNFWILWEIADRLKGRMESGQVFLQSLWEFNNVYYLKLLLSLDDLTEFLFGTPASYASGHRVYDTAAAFLSPYGFTDPSFYEITDLPDEMQSEVKSGLQPSALRRLVVGGPHFDLIVRSYTVLWLAVRDIINVAIIATVLCCFRAGARWPAVLMGLIIIYNAAVIALVGGTYIRYVDQIAPLSILLAGLSVSSFVGGRFGMPARRPGRG